MPLKSIAPRCTSSSALMSARKGVLAVRLLKGLIALEIGVIADRMRQLFQDDDDADTSQHAANDSIGKVIADYTGAQQTESDLQQTGEEYCGQNAENEPSDVIAASTMAVRPAAGSAHHEVRARGQADYDAADNAGDDTGEQRCTGCQRDAKAERQGDQEHHHRGSEVGTPRITEIGFPVRAGRIERALFGDSEGLESGIDVGGVMLTDASGRRRIGPFGNRSLKKLPARHDGPHTSSPDAR